MPCVIFCSRNAPNPSSLASHFTLFSLLMLKCLFRRLIYCLFVFVECDLCFSSQSNLLDLFDVVDESNGRSSGDSVARLEISLIRRWILPINHPPLSLMFWDFTIGQLHLFFLLSLIYIPTKLFLLN